MHRANVELERYPQTMKEVSRIMQKKREELHLIEPTRSKTRTMEEIQNQKHLRTETR